MRTTIYGKELSSGRTLHIDDVQKDLNLKFICGECSNTLIPVKTFARGKDWHFRHPGKSDIVKCRQTGLHDFAVQVLLSATEIQINKSQRITYTIHSKENWLENLYRSDFSAWYDKTIVHFEVFVTHNLTPDKSKFYSNKMIRCVKIDLSEKRLLKASPEEVKNLVLNDYANKSLFGWEEKVETVNSGPDFWNGFLTFLKWAFLAWLIYLVLKYIFKRQPAYVSTNQKPHCRSLNYNSRQFQI